MSGPPIDPALALRLERAKAADPLRWTCSECKREVGPMGGHAESCACKGYDGAPLPEPSELPPPMTIDRLIFYGASFEVHEGGKVTHVKRDSVKLLPDGSYLLEGTIYEPEKP